MSTKMLFHLELALSGAVKVGLKNCHFTTVILAVKETTKVSEQKFDPEQMAMQLQPKIMGAKYQIDIIPRT